MSAFHCGNQVSSPPSGTEVERWTEEEARDRVLQEKVVVSKVGGHFLEALLCGSFSAAGICQTTKQLQQATITFFGFVFPFVLQPLDRCSPLSPERRRVGQEVPEQGESNYSASLGKYLTTDWVVMDI